MTELLFRNDGYLRSCTARVMEAGPDGIRLDRTVFYPTGGGQPGDTGVLRFSSGRVDGDRRYGQGRSPDEVIHIPEPGSSVPSPGRARCRDRLGTASPADAHAHLPASVVRVVPGAVTGGQVSDGRGRLDFDVPWIEPRQRGDRKPGSTN